MTIAATSVTTEVTNNGGTIVFGILIKLFMMMIMISIMTMMMSMPTMKVMLMT